MINFQPILRAYNKTIYDMIQPYRVTDDKQMPWAYQFANPKGRPYHDDWGIMSQNPILKAIQPFQKIRRMDCAYRLPLPFRQTYGNTSRKWMVWDLSYPTVADTPIEEREVFTSDGRFVYPHALVDEGGPGWTTFAANINGEWVNCFKKYYNPILGKRFSYYNGLKQDLTVGFNDDWTIKSDLMAWFPEISVSWAKHD